MRVIRMAISAAAIMRHCSTSIAGTPGPYSADPIATLSSIPSSFVMIMLRSSVRAEQISASLKFLSSGFPADNLLSYSPRSPALPKPDTLSTPHFLPSDTCLQVFLDNYKQYLYYAPYVATPQLIGPVLQHPRNRCAACLRHSLDRVRPTGRRKTSGQGRERHKEISRPCLAWKLSPI